jgi:hypothetical protein
MSGFDSSLSRLCLMRDDRVTNEHRNAEASAQRSLVRQSLLFSSLVRQSLLFIRRAGGNGALFDP